MEIQKRIRSTLTLGRKSLFPQECVTANYQSIHFQNWNLNTRRTDSKKNTDLQSLLWFLPLSQLCSACFNKMTGHWRNEQNNRITSNQQWKHKRQHQYPDKSLGWEIQDFSVPLQRFNLRRSNYSSSSSSSSSFCFHTIKKSKKTHWYIQSHVQMYVTKQCAAWQSNDTSFYTSAAMQNYPLYPQCTW